VIPRGGYRPEDMIDDAPGVGAMLSGHRPESPSAEGFRTAMGQNPSAEGLMAAIVQGRRDVAEELRVALAEYENPSAEGRTTPERSRTEVRESAVVYRIDRRTG
jgi:hypothetical protein